MIEFINEHDPQFIKGRAVGIKEGIEKVTKIGIEKGIEIGTETRNREIASNLLNSGLSDEMILSATGITAEELEAIKAENKTN